MTEQITSPAEEYVLPKELLDAMAIARGRAPEEGKVVKVRADEMFPVSAEHRQYKERKRAAAKAYVDAERKRKAEQAAKQDELRRAARELTSQGVASVAEGLASTLNALSAAAVEEARQLAADAVAQMAQKTDTELSEAATRSAAPAKQTPSSAKSKGFGRLLHRGPK